MTMSDPTPKTHGIHHLGLSVLDLEQTTGFFTKTLGWKEVGRDDSYPRTIVTDGHARLTLWQVDRTPDVQPFDRRRNVGLHHLALEIDTEEHLHDLARVIRETPDAKIEFLPEPVGTSPRRHMMCREPGGLRIEFIWSGTPS